MSNDFNVEKSDTGQWGVKPIDDQRNTPGDDSVQSSVSTDDSDAGEVSDSDTE